MHKVANEKKTLAITHVRLGWGGSEKRVLWAIQALKDEYDVTLITAGQFDLEGLNRYYGTNLHSGEFAVRQVPLPFFMRNNAKAAALRGAFYQRFCRKIADDYDILISGYGPTDFGRPAIHFITDFSWDDDIREMLHPKGRGVIYRDGLLRSAYLRLSNVIRLPSGRDVFSGDDLMLAVSPWVSRLLKKKFSVDAPVLHSPVPGEFHPPPWEKKQLGFVCMGRLSPEKRIEDVIAILEGVRNRGHDVHLHIVGEGNSGAYVDKIRALAEKRASWVHMEGKLVGSSKVKILEKHRFGIHACHGDAFPGVLIEMMKAGCVVWAHGSGGQRDILKADSLLYSSIEAAVDKIHAVLLNNEEQVYFQEKLAKMAESYSVNTYMKLIDDIVAGWNNGR